MMRPGLFCGYNDFGRVFDAASSIGAEKTSQSQSK
jgi:hypothetical protein